MKSGAAWPIAVGIVLAVTVAANVFLIVLANDHAAAVVEPDYYRKAVSWDSTLAAERHDRDLGWRLEADLGAIEQGGADLAVRITAPDGTPIEGARVEVVAIHNLEAASPRRATLVSSGDGRYRARLPLGRAGLWELRFDVARGRDRFDATLRRDAARAGS